MQNKSPLIKRFGAVVLIVLAVALTVFALPAFAEAQLQQTLTDTETIYSQIYNQVSPSVVAINVSGTAANGAQTGGSGSGFVIDKDGHIVTNNHVVDGATSIEVDFLDGTLARAQVIGTDPDSDLAVIQVDLPADVLTPVTFADSDALEIGQSVLAIGSPFGQRWTLTEGIVSALDRTIQGLTNFSIGGVIQTDAPINPGNSGGPLLDIQGRVIGVNSQILSSTGSSSGIGFAIPSNLTQKVATELIQKGFVEYSYIGISGGDVNLDLIEGLDLPSNTRGVVVSEVVAGGPAARAGLHSAGENIVINNLRVPQSVDIITAINGQPLSGIADLISYLAKNTTPGDTVTLTVLRSGQGTMDFDVQLTPRK